MRYRVDASPAASDRWENTFDGRTSTIMPETAASGEQFVKAIQGGKRLVIETDTYQEAARGVTRVLNIDGVGAIIPRLRSECVSASQAQKR